MISYENGTLVFLAALHREHKEREKDLSLRYDRALSDLLEVKMQTCGFTVLPVSTVASSSHFMLKKCVKDKPDLPNSHPLR